MAVRIKHHDVRVWPSTRALRDPNPQAIVHLQPFGLNQSVLRNLRKPTKFLQRIRQDTTQSRSTPNPPPLFKHRTPFSITARLNAEIHQQTRAHHTRRHRRRARPLHHVHRHAIAPSTIVTPAIRLPTHPSHSDKRVVGIAIARLNLLDAERAVEFQRSALQSAAPYPE